MTLTCDTCRTTGPETVIGFVTVTVRVPDGRIDIPCMCHGCRDRARRAGTVVAERPFGVAPGARWVAGDGAIGRGPHGAYVVRTPPRVRRGWAERDDRPDAPRPGSDANRPPVPVAGGRGVIRPGMVGRTAGCIA